MQCRVRFEHASPLHPAHSERVVRWLFARSYPPCRNEQRATEQRAQSERDAAEKRAQTERDIALDNQRETALQSYIDKLSELLLHEKLRESKPEDEVRKIGRVRTLTVLPRLDNERKKRM